jgi:dolichyl-phosphooligosaccharide-protein glycotransferase
MRADASSARRPPVATPLGLFALAFAVRALPWREVLTAERVYPFGNDAYYHLRRIVYSLAHFPAVLAHDPYINFPTGAKPIWTPVFDLCIAALARPLSRSLAAGGLEDAERFAVWVPPVLGAATVVALWALARRHFGPSVAALAGAFLAVLSGHFWYSQIGFVDHHVAVALVTTGMLAGGMAGLDADARGRARRARADALATGLALGLAVAVWPGSLLHAGLLDLGLLGYLLARPSARQAAAFARCLAWVHLVAFAVVSPLALGNHWPQWGDFSPVVLSNFQPWLFASGALWAAACAALFAGRWGGTRAGRAALALGLGAVLLALGVAAVPGLTRGVGEAWRWLAKDETFQGIVSESQPLLWTDGHFDLLVAATRLSGFGLLLPFALAGLALGARRHPRRAPLGLLLFWTAGLLAATLMQRRFFNSLCVALALVFALCVVGSYRRLSARLRTRPVARRLAAAALALGVWLLLVPTLWPYARLVANEVAARRGEKLVVTPGFAAARVAVETAAWLRAKTPPTSGWLDDRIRPEYGVLAPWHLGHILQYVGRRPVVVDNFGDDVGEESFAWSRRYYLGSEAEAWPELRARRVRYVVAQRQALFLGQEAPVGTLLHSLYYLDGSRLVPGEGMQVPAVRALEHHRLVFESDALDWHDEDAPATYKVYEVVEGAQVEGRAPPGARIDVELALRSNRRRAFRWESDARSDAQGRYRLRLPYANYGSPPATHVGRYYVLRCRGEEAYVTVLEPQVEKGSVVHGPDLCTGASAPPPPRPLELLRRKSIE